MQWLWSQNFAKHVALLNFQRERCQQMCIRHMSAKKGIAQDMMLGNDETAAEFGFMPCLILVFLCHLYTLVKIVKLVSWEFSCHTSHTLTYQEGFYIRMSPGRPFPSFPRNQDLTIVKRRLRSAEFISWWCVLFCKCYILPLGSLTSAPCSVKRSTCCSIKATCRSFPDQPEPGWGRTSSGLSFIQINRKQQGADQHRSTFLEIIRSLIHFSEFTVLSGMYLLYIYL